MGIRYERDNKKATNGPLVFFSILRDEVFEEEIRSAFISGLSFYAYRFPGDSMLTYGSSEGYVEGLGEPGFVIGRFLPDLPLITIPYRGVKRNMDGCVDDSLDDNSLGEKDKEIDLRSNNAISLDNNRSTTYEEYSREVEEIIKAIKEGKGDKVVASRLIVKDIDFDIAEKFYDLCERNPEAFVFCFSTPATGCWIGASPELLLEGREERLYSMALAGTRKVKTLSAWDEKNIEEQRIVTEYIERIFKENGYSPKIGDTFTKSSGTIEHLCTEIEVNLRDRRKNGPKTEGGVENFSHFELEKILHELSPTPALCGYPKDFALDQISRYEKFDRGCYGGYCGPYRSPEDFSFRVVIRCSQVDERLCRVYAGGGITAQSDVASEWAETELKAGNF